MDVDQINEHVDLLSYFNLSPDCFPWCHPRPQQIHARRAQISDLLIFDILLASGNVQQPDTLYPPTDVPSLKRLLDAIENSTYDALKRDCLVYYLLKWYQDGREVVFQQERCIPPQFALLADAYWHLDSGINVANAVAILSDARLNTEYASKILQVLSLSGNATPLVLKYVRTAKPLLAEPDDIDIYTTALVESSLLEAWQFQRTFPENSESRSRVIQKILQWCLSPKPRSKPLTQLIAFPFSNYEQSLIHEYALHPPPTCPMDSIPIVQDLVCVRLIQSGQHAAAIKLDRQLALTVTKATGKMKKVIEDRRRTMDEIMATMPIVEKNMLEMELGQLAQGKGLSSISSSGSGESFNSNTEANDLSMSWEHVSPPRLAVNGSIPPLRNHPREHLHPGGSPIPTIPDRSGAPQFVGGLHSRPAINGSTPKLPINETINVAATSASQSRHPTFTSSIPQPLTSSLLSSPNPLRTPISSAGPKYPPARSIPGLFGATAPVGAAIPSLFDSVGSANLTRNAFYDPPVTIGVKRTFGQDEPRTAPESTAPVNPPRDDDIDMFSDDDVVRPRQTSKRKTNGTETPPDELPFSIFSTSAETAQSSRQVARTETQTKMPPGAFVSDSDEENELETTSRHNGRPRVSPPLLRPHQSRTSRSQKPVKEPDFGRSLPGALVVEEEEDHITPLPVPRPTRKGKTSRARSYDDDAGALKQPRRSSRLMTTPSVTSSSPEPSPKKAQPKSKKSTRASAAGTAVSKSGTRKKK